MKILFVCYGNICRSPMAEAVLKQRAKENNLDLFVDSAATSREEIGEPPHSGTRKILDQHKIDYSGIFARQVTKDDYDNFDLIIAMDENNLKDLKKMGNPKPNQLHLLADFVEDATWTSVPDPWYTGNFEETYRLVDAGCNGILSYLNLQN